MRRALGPGSSVLMRPPARGAATLVDMASSEKSAGHASVRDRALRLLLEQSMREEDGLVAAEEVGTGAGRDVKQTYPRKCEIPPQPARRRWQGTHTVMAAAVHLFFIITLVCKGASGQL